MTTRRGFLGAILAAAAAPAVVKSGILMPTRKIITPPVALWRPMPYIQTGDVFTISGVGVDLGGSVKELQLFKVTAVADSEPITLSSEMAEFDRLFHRLSPSLAVAR